MEHIRELGNVDVYVIDQLMKGAIHKELRLLDAGCGSGRNFSYFANNNFDITGIDPDKECIRNLQNKFPNLQKQLSSSTIEDFQPEKDFDFIICNAVLHFANDHFHFNHMVEKLISFLAPEGSLFIRMTTDHGMQNLPYSESGVYYLPDNSNRYLITRNKVSEICQDHSISLSAPFKTVLVENWRSMATIVLKKADLH